MRGVREPVVRAGDDLQAAGVQGRLGQPPRVVRGHQLILLTMDEQAIPRAHRGAEVSSLLHFGDEGVSQTLCTDLFRMLGKIVQVRRGGPGRHRLDLEIRLAAKRAT